MINRVTFKQIAKKSKSNNGSLLLYIRVTINRTPFYLNTGHKVFEKDWNKQKNEVKLSNSNAYQINNFIRDKIVKMEKLIIEFNELNRLITFQDFQMLFENKKEVVSEDISFTSFFKQELSQKNDIDFDTKKKYQRTFEKFKTYKEEVAFSQVNYELVQGFEYFLINQNQSPNTRKKNHQILGYFINQAIAKEKLVKNPYFSFKKPKADTSRDILIASEVEKIEKLIFTPEQQYLEKTRDMFLFGCYTGLRESDLLTLAPEHLHIEGDKVILKMKMEKSKIGKYIILKLHELEFRNPIPLLMKYLKEGNKTIFPTLSNPQTNHNLEKITEIADIQKHITIHCSRHTFAVNTYAVIKDVLKLRKYLGQSKLETTMIYVKMYEELFF